MADHMKPSNTIAEMIKQATENCAKCGKGKNATQKHIHYSSNVESNDQYCSTKTHTYTGKGPSHISSEPLWPHFLCSRCYQTECRPHGSSQDSCSTMLNTCAQPLIAPSHVAGPIDSHGYSPRITMHSSSETSTFCIQHMCKPDDCHKPVKSHPLHADKTPAISCPTCKAPKKTYISQSSNIPSSSDNQRCMCQCSANPRDSGWIVHRK